MKTKITYIPSFIHIFFLFSIIFVSSMHASSAENNKITGNKLRKIEYIFKKIITVKRLFIFRAFTLFYCFFFTIIFNQAIQHADICAKPLLNWLKISQFFVDNPVIMEFMRVELSFAPPPYLGIPCGIIVLLFQLFVVPGVDITCLKYLLDGHKNILYILNHSLFFTFWHGIFGCIYLKLCQKSIEFAKKKMLEKSRNYIQKDDTKVFRFFDQFNPDYLLIRAIKNYAVNILKYCTKNRLYDIDKILLELYLKGDIFPTYGISTSPNDYYATKELWKEFFHCLQTQVDINRRGEGENNPLHFLCQTISDNSLENTDHYSILKDIYLDMFRFLLSYLAEWLHQKNSSGYTPLQLLILGEEDQLKDQFKRDLYDALVTDFQDEVKELSHFLLNFFQINKPDTTCVMRMVQHCCEKYEIDVNKIIDPDTGNTIFHLIARKENLSSHVFDLFEYLFKKGCKINTKNKDGFFPLDYMQIHDRVAIWLKKRGAVISSDENFLQLREFSRFEQCIQSNIIARLVICVHDNNISNLAEWFNVIYPELSISFDENTAITTGFIDNIIKEQAPLHPLFNQEFDIVTQCISFFSPYSHYNVKPYHAYTELLLRIVEKRSESIFNLKEMVRIDMIFNKLLSYDFIYDFQEYSKIGENVFHIIARTGLEYYFDKIILLPQTHDAINNIYQALTAPMLTKTNFNSNVDNTTPIKIAKEQEKIFMGEQYPSLCIKMQNAIDNFEKLKDK